MILVGGGADTSGEVDYEALAEFIRGAAELIEDELGERQDDQIVSNIK